MECKVPSSKKNGWIACKCPEQTPHPPKPNELTQAAEPKQSQYNQPPVTTNEDQIERKQEKVLEEKEEEERNTYQTKNTAK